MGKVNSFIAFFFASIYYLFIIKNSYVWNPQLDIAYGFIIILFFLYLICNFINIFLAIIYILIICYYKDNIFFVNLINGLVLAYYFKRQSYNKYLLYALILGLTTVFLCTIFGICNNYIIQGRMSLGFKNPNTVHLFITLCIFYFYLYKKFYIIFVLTILQILLVFFTHNVTYILVNFMLIFIDFSQINNYVKKFFVTLVLLSPFLFYIINQILLYQEYPFIFFQNPIYGNYEGPLKSLFFRLNTLLYYQYNINIFPPLNLPPLIDNFYINSFMSIGIILYLLICFFIIKNFNKITLLILLLGTVENLVGSISIFFSLLFINFNEKLYEKY